MALWSGRFEEGVDAFTQRFGASLPVDQRLYAQDIAGSKAHAAMLAAQGVIPQEDAAAIAEGLDGIQKDIESGSFVFDINNEDIHMAIESALTECIGSAGARLHTGRSRNDQVATDTRLFAKQRAADLMAANLALREALLAQAEANFDVILPGYTHLQHAQPVLFSHHMLAYVWMLARDFDRLAAAQAAADANPLGAAALAGTTYPLDRFATTAALGFDHPIPNSLDAVSDRDFLLDLLYACSVSCLHLSRLCEELVLWSSSEFGFVTLSDSYATGSSIMPQKKNPDFAELIRGKSGRVVGDLMALMMTLKGLPLAYNKDLQEDKQGAMDAADTLEDCYVCAAGMIATMQVNPEAMMAQAKKGYLAATDVADYLAKKGLPFRQAHEVVGHLVLLCEKRGCDLEDLTLADFQAESPLFEADIAGALNLEAIVAARTTYGGTGHEAVRAQMVEAQARQATDQAKL
ncbi:argininosuccinate lyase [uncultured Adlercreutzia sp.]|uniref:argininosuccinate lyase n=1 Tax=uncultured Adlercreutzia sp. TaxID=875803 RepID=UPI0025D80B16|nr:argininosuccinate lyase [uncultured Adlercreutzia sp.]MCI9262817.1 argininosuccinate lyase [Eggerthellaceae bacterium]